MSTGGRSWLRRSGPKRRERLRRDVHERRPGSNRRNRQKLIHARPQQRHAQRLAGYEAKARPTLGEVLGEDPPVPDTQAVLFFKQWLAERNLGLVPIARAATFEWPGRWLAACANSQRRPRGRHVRRAVWSTVRPGRRCIQGRRDRGGLVARAA